MCAVIVFGGCFLWSGFLRMCFWGVFFLWPFWGWFFRGGFGDVFLVFFWVFFRCLVSVVSWIVIAKLMRASLGAGFVEYEAISQSMFFPKSPFENSNNMKLVLTYGPAYNWHGKLC